MKPLAPKFCPDLFIRLKDIAEKQVPAKLKPIVAVHKCQWIQNIRLKHFQLDKDPETEAPKPGEIRKY